MSSGDAGADWMRCLRDGEWAAAWTISDRVLRARGGVRDWTRPRHEQAVWDGSDLAHRHVLVRCYHGLGDTVQFARYLPRLAGVAAEVSVWAQPALIPLLRTVAGPARWLPLHDGAPDLRYGVDVEIMELAHVFRTTPETVPREIPYLHVPRPDARRDARFRVGLVWQAGDWDAARSVPPQLLRPLAIIPGVELGVLQRGPALAAAPPELGPSLGADDLIAAARTMTALDLVLTVDSLPAHLAGALGVPVWTMLRHDADWRWMAGRADTPWYPTMRLFRQPRPGDWHAVVAEVATALARLGAAELARPGATEIARPGATRSGG